MTVEEVMRNINKDFVINNINLKVAYTLETPREILEADNPSAGSIPISGGWGYTHEDCVIINKDDPSVSQSIPFDGVAIEYFFVEKRIYEELIIFRKPGQQFNGIKWEKLEQSLIFKDDRQYDHLRFLVKGHIDKDWRYLKKAFEDNNKFEDDEEELKNYLKENEELLYCFETDYWFDITSFFY